MRPRKTTTNSRKNYYGTMYRTARRNHPINNTTWSCNSPRFHTLRNQFQWRIGSYQNVYNQFTTGRKTVFSPNTANRWMRYVNNGVQVYEFTHRNFVRFFGPNLANQSPTTIHRYLAYRYGKSTIKDVARGNNNTWLIATTRTPTARPFRNYNWK